MTDWITADWHLGHEAIIHFCNRPFQNTHQMEKILVKNVNSLVKEDDCLYFLGDLFWGGTDKANNLGHILQKIKGRKILILGNHDRIKPLSYIDLGIESVHTSLRYKMLNVMMVHDPAWAAAIPRDWVVLCGHIHDLFKVSRNVVNVGVDVWDFKPVKIDDVIKLIER
jgi:calcineurin-like phosphoesterase family protein